MAGAAELGGEANAVAVDAFGAVIFAIPTHQHAFVIFKDPPNDDAGRAKVIDNAGTRLNGPICFTLVHFLVSFSLSSFSLTA